MLYMMEEISDNIMNLIESSWDSLRPHLTETKFSKEAIFKTQILYPELACREALIMPLLIEIIA